MVMTILISFTMEDGKEHDRYIRVLQGDPRIYQPLVLRQVHLRKDFLDGIKHIRYSKGLFMIRREDEMKVLTFLKRKGAKVFEWEVVPKREELRSLGLRTA
ncbi:MAG: hypothetical protein QXZ17_14870 [Nitrososphaerota archaeon]